jgi:transposase
MVATRRRKFSAEYKAEAVRMVVETSRPIARVAADLGINEGTLGNWVNAYRREHPQDDEPLTPAERAKMLELQAENRELRMELEFLKKAAAYFARE